MNSVEKNAKFSNSTASVVRVVPHAGGSPPTQEECEARLHQEGYESFCWYDVPGTLYPKHRHVNHECLWILKGEITFTVKNEDYRLHPGDRLYLPAGVDHLARVPAATGVTYVVGQRAPDKPSEGTPENSIPKPSSPPN